MRSTRAAEWIVGRFISGERAAAVVGDLTELQAQKGAVWFWLSVLRVLIAFSWRSVLGIMAAFYLGGRVLSILTMMFLNVHAIHRAKSNSWVLILLANVDALLWMILTYGLIRYGSDDRVIRLTFLWAALVGMVLCGWQQPIVLGVCIASGSGLIILSMMKERERRGTSVLAATLLSGCVTNLLFFGICTLCLHLFFPALLPVRGLQKQPLINRISVLLLSLAAWIVTTGVFSRMHRWMLRIEKAGPAAEPEIV
jgi:hypothetical protein